MPVSLSARINTLALQGYDSWANPVPDALASITITNRAKPDLLPVVINEWMADNAGPAGFPDLLDGGFADWFELYNPNDSAVDLSGYSLTDTLAEPAKWRIPPGTIIAPRGFLLVWADDETEQNGQGGSSDLHASFQLSRSGESLGLFSPEGTLQYSITFGPQQENASEGLFPDGQTNSSIRMPNWTPRASNQAGDPPPPGISEWRLQPNGSMLIESAAVTGRVYRVEHTDALDGRPWLPLGEPVRANAGTVQFSTPATTNSQSFFRLILMR
jgi:hypothetical protein